MPAINRDEAVLKKLCIEVTPSVVSVNTYSKPTSYTLDFTTGFIIYSIRKMTLIFVSSSVLKAKKVLYVHFSNGETEKAEIFLKNTSSGYVILRTSGRTRRAVSFRRDAPAREDVFTISEVEGGYSAFNFMTGTICCPNCKAINENSGAIVRKSEETFLMTCAAVKWPHRKETKDQLIGAAIFDMIHGAVVGTIKMLDGDIYDWKFCSQATPHWVNELEKLLKAKDNTIKLERVGGQRKRKCTQASGTGELQLGQDGEIF